MFLVKQAHEHKVRAVLPWFDTWKNTSPQYVPEGAKFDERRLPLALTDEVFPIHS